VAVVRDWLAAPGGLARGAGLAGLACAAGLECAAAGAAQPVTVAMAAMNVAAAVRRASRFVAAMGHLIGRALAC